MACRVFQLLTRCAVPATCAVLAACAGLAACGCASTSVLQAGQRAALDSFDLEKMTDEMARKMNADPRVLSEFESSGPLAVVVMPARNRLTGEVLPRGQADAFTARVRVLLSRHAPGRYTWVMNRDTFDALRARELELDLGPSPGAIDPRYALTATFQSLSDEDATRRSAYYLCAYELIRLDDRSVLWTDAYEVKKVAVKGFLD
jgi:hypothetical protein